MIIGKLCIQYPVRLKRFTGDLKTNKQTCEGTKTRKKMNKKAANAETKMLKNFRKEPGELLFIKST